MFPDYPSGRVWPIRGRLDSDGRGRRAHRRSDYHRDHNQRDAVSLATLPAPGAAQLGLSAPATAITGAVGRRGDVRVQLLRQTLLLLLQVLQLLPTQRRGNREERELGGVRQSGHVVGR